MSVTGPQGVKLRIADVEDLAAVSLHVQDAILRIGDVHRIHRTRRFALILNRFRWEAAGGRLSFRPQARIRAGLHFDYVVNVRIRGLDATRREDFLELLAVTFASAPEPPAGIIQLTFAGGAVIALDVECIDGALIDIGAPWRANRPVHKI